MLLKATLSLTFLLLGSIMMMRVLSSDADQWRQDLVRLPDHALTQLQRENSKLAKAISRELERRADLMKYRKFRLRCIIPAFLGQFNSDEDDSPGEFADAIESGLIKLSTAISTYQGRINISHWCALVCYNFGSHLRKEPFHKLS